MLSGVKKQNVSRDFEFAWVMFPSLFNLRSSDLETHLLFLPDNEPVYNVLHSNVVGGARSAATQIWATEWVWRELRSRHLELMNSQMSFNCFTGPIRQTACSLNFRVVKKVCSEMLSRLQFTSPKCRPRLKVWTTINNKRSCVWGSISKGEHCMIEVAKEFNSSKLFYRMIVKC